MGGKKEIYRGVRLFHGALQILSDADSVACWV